MAKVLIIRFKPIKSFMQSVPSFAAIRKHHENDEISILTEKSLIRFCKKSGFFNKVWLDSKPLWFEPRGIIDIVKRLKRGNFDFVYDLDNSARSEWYFRLIGRKKPKWNSSIIDWCSHPYIEESKDVLHFQDTLQNQLAVAGITKVPDIDLSFMEKPNVREHLPQNYVMICAAGDKEKLSHKWDAFAYAETIDRLEADYNLKSVLVGDDNDDYWLNEYVIDKCVTAKPINFSGKTTLRGLISVANGSKFCLGNETSPTHIAAYSNCKTIMLCSRFSPPELLAPRVKNLAVIEEGSLKNLSVERVFEAIEEFGLKTYSDTPYKVMGETKAAPPEADFER